MDLEPRVQACKGGRDPQSSDFLRVFLLTFRVYGFRCLCFQENFQENVLHSEPQDETLMNPKNLFRDGGESTGPSSTLQDFGLRVRGQPKGDQPGYQPSTVA